MWDSNGFTFDLVPCISEAGIIKQLETDNIYRIWYPSGQLTSSPYNYAHTFADRNLSCGGCLIPAVRFLKAWNQANTKKRGSESLKAYSSFQLEQVAGEIAMRSRFQTR